MPQFLVRPLKSVFNKISRLGLGQVFSYEFYKVFEEHLFYRTPPCDCFWFGKSSLEVTGSNQGITVLIEIIIHLYKALVKVFHNSVKD